MWIQRIADLPHLPFKALILGAIVVLLSFSVAAQKGTLTLFGDVRIEEPNSGQPPSHITVVLYKDVGGEVGRQNVANGTRYRFSNLRPGDYELAVEINDHETTRIRVSMAPGTLSNSPYGFQQDLTFAWRPNAATKSGTISAADVYSRSDKTRSLFKKAEAAVTEKRYDEAESLLKQIVEKDPNDFQAWTLLGTVCRVEQKSPEAEKAYQSAIALKPTFVLALVDLGRLLFAEKKFAEAIEPLTHALENQPGSGDANFLLGEAYLQIRKGSKAIPYMNAAAGLGHPEAHLRLGWLYNAAGLKDKAAIEYEEFLRKQPDYPERKKLEEYISANK